MNSISLSLKLSLLLSIFFSPVSEGQVDPNKIARFVLNHNQDDYAVPGLVLRLLRLWETQSSAMSSLGYDQLEMKEQMSDIIALTRLNPNECSSKSQLLKRRRVELELGSGVNLNALLQHLNRVQFFLCISTMDGKLNEVIEQLEEPIQILFSQLSNNDQPPILNDENQLDFRAHLRVADLLVDEQHEDPIINTRARMIGHEFAFLMKHKNLIDNSNWHSKVLSIHFKTITLQWCSYIETKSEFSADLIELMEAIRLDYGFEQNLKWQKIYDVCVLVAARPEVFENAEQVYNREFEREPKRPLKLDYHEDFDKLLKLLNEPNINMDTRIIEGTKFLNRYHVRSHLDTLEIIKKLSQLYQLQTGESIPAFLETLLGISTVHASKCNGLQRRLEIQVDYDKVPSLFHYIRTYNEQQVDACRRILIDAVELALVQTEVDSIIHLSELTGLVRHGREMVPLARWYHEWKQEFVTGVAMWLYLNHGSDHDNGTANEPNVLKARFEELLSEACGNLFRISRSHSLIDYFTSLVEVLQLEPNLSTITFDTVGYALLCQAYYISSNFDEIYERYQGIRNHNWRPKNFEKLLQYLS